MTTIMPPGGAVWWPKDEGVLGVVGVAPWATLDFIRAFYELVPAERDWHYPRVLADLNAKIPSRGRHLELGERDPSPFIATTVGELLDQGATTVVVPCNTAHILYPRWAVGYERHLLSIVDATVDAVCSSGARRVAVLSARAVRSHRLYANALAATGIGEYELADADLSIVLQVIDAVKRHGRVDTHLQGEVQALARRLADHVGVDGFVLACTELSALADCCRPYAKIIDSNVALAAAALGRIWPAPGGQQGVAGGESREMQ